MLNKNPLLEMATVGKFNLFKIYVCGEPYKNPTFHLEYKYQNKDDIDCFLAIIQIKDLKVLDFEIGKIKKITQKTFNKLKSFLQSNHYKFNTMTYWEYLIYSWNNENPTNKLPENFPLPTTKEFIYSSKLNL